MNLAIGSKAPAIKLPDQTGKMHSLNDYLGSWVLLYFYPKDDTPGCTVEACTLRDAHPDFQKINAVVIGISADTQEKHAKFVGKYDLPFTLLSDPEHHVLESYGVWQAKQMMGRRYMGIVRSSVLVDPAGKIAKAYPTVKPAEHAAQVLGDLKTLAQ